MTTNLINERLKVVTLEELVDKQKSSEPDLPSLEKVLKKIDDEKKQTGLKIKKVANKLESQKVEILTRNEEKKRIEKEKDILHEEKKNMIEELLQVR